MKQPKLNAVQLSKKSEWIININEAPIAMLYNKYLVDKVTDCLPEINMESMVSMLESDYIKADYHLYEGKIVQTHSDKVVGKIISTAHQGLLFEKLNKAII